MTASRSQARSSAICGCDCLVRGRNAPSFGRGQKRIKTFCVKIMKDDIAPRGCPSRPHRFRQRVIETIGSRMANHDKRFHRPLPNVVFVLGRVPSLPLGPQDFSPATIAPTRAARRLPIHFRGVQTFAAGPLSNSRCESAMCVMRVPGHCITLASNGAISLPIGVNASAHLRRCRKGETRVESQH